MPFPTKKLRVFPNPWTFIDHLGRPAGRLPPDGYEDSPSAGPVGAMLTDVVEVQKTMTMRVAGQDVPVNLPQHDHRVVYSKDSVEIPNTAYYRYAVKSREIVAADAETAAVCGIKFEDPAKLLAYLRSISITQFDAETGEDAYKKFGAVEPLYTKPAASPVSASVPVEAVKAESK